MKVNENYGVATILLGPAVISAAVSPALTHVGRMILPAARMGLLHAGIMGAIQTVVGNFVWAMLSDKNNDTKIVSAAKFIASHALVAGALIAISLLAMQVGIVASSTTFTAMLMLAIANCALSYGTFKGTGALLGFLEDKKWVEFVKS